VHVAIVNWLLFPLGLPAFLEAGAAAASDESGYERAQGLLLAALAICDIRRALLRFSCTPCAPSIKHAPQGIKWSRCYRLILN